jgi:hypothetical protein
MIEDVSDEILIAYKKHKQIEIEAAELQKQKLKEQVKYDLHVYENRVLMLAHKLGMPLLLLSDYLFFRDVITKNYFSWQKVGRIKINKCIKYGVAGF